MTTWLDVLDDTVDDSPPSMPIVKIETNDTPVEVEVTTVTTRVIYHKPPRSVVLGSTSRSKVIIKPALTQPLTVIPPRDQPWELVGPPNRGKYSKSSGRGSSHFKSEKSGNCVRCGKPNAFLILYKAHIDSFEEYIKSGDVTEEAVANAKEGFHCTSCLTTMSPKCKTCGIGPRMIVNRGSHPFALHCQECRRKHNQQSKSTVKEDE